MGSFRVWNLDSLFSGVLQNTISQSNCDKNDYYLFCLNGKKARVCCCSCLVFKSDSWDLSILFRFSRVLKVRVGSSHAVFFFSEVISSQVRYHLFPSFLPSFDYSGIELSSDFASSIDLYFFFPPSTEFSTKFWTFQLISLQTLWIWSFGS